MASNRLAFIALGLACVAAAGGGSYLATRQNVASIAVPTAQAALANSLTQPAIEPGEAISGRARPGDLADGSANGAAKGAVARARSLAAAPAAEVTAAPVSAARRAAQPRPDPTTNAEPPLEAAARVQDGAAVSDRGGFANVPAAPVTAPEAPEAVPTISPDARPVEIPLRPEPADRRFQELVVSADSVIGLQTEGALSSERARVEDQVEARVVRDVRVNGDVAIPAGTRALGTVVVVERGGRLRDRARLGIRFQSLLFADGSRTPITTETIFRLGDPPSNGSAAKIGGGAVAGAILGAIIGGGKGAAIGATAGAGGGAAAVMSSERAAALFPPGSEVTARILSPITVTVERE